MNTYYNIGMDSYGKQLRTKRTMEVRGMKISTEKQHVLDTTPPKILIRNSLAILSDTKADPEYSKYSKVGEISAYKCKQIICNECILYPECGDVTAPDGLKILEDYINSFSEEDLLEYLI